MGSTRTFKNQTFGQREMQQEEITVAQTEKSEQLKAKYLYLPGRILYFSSICGFALGTFFFVTISCIRLALIW